MIKGLIRPLAIVAHDAGAANHIFAWLGDEQPALCLAGPAQALWQAHLKKAHMVFSSGPRAPDSNVVAQTPLANSSLVATLASAATVITGTGWESNLEHDARRLAREMGIYSIAVIDHWTNYADRFVRNGEQVLPNEIWVSDLYAAEIAQETFPSVRVILQDNAYLASLVGEVESHQPPGAFMGNDRVLYVLEPIRDSWGKLVELGEFIALDYFMAHRQCASISADAEIRLRPHPSDPPGKYSAWLVRQANSRVSLDQSDTLAGALGWSNVVVGCQTYAMVLALACGRTVISTIPPWAPPCVLPHKKIKKLSNHHPMG